MFLLVYAVGIVVFLFLFLIVVAALGNLSRRVLKLEKDFQSNLENFDKLITLSGEIAKEQNAFFSTPPSTNSAEMSKLKKELHDFQDLVGEWVIQTQDLLEDILGGPPKQQSTKTIQPTSPPVKNNKKTKPN